jgi:dipeptidyl aminopeptidase/acylaminoacyl peptidase
MTLFRRALRLFFAVVGFVLGLATFISAYLARIMIAPARQELRATPHSKGLEYEDVQFPASDGLRVSGWFVPAPGNAAAEAATIIVTHGWQWNRQGFEGGRLFSNVTGSEPVDLLRLIVALHAAGFNVLAIDMRNHGESAAARPVTFGQSEAKDLLGALDYLKDRDDVDDSRIGMLGFSIGANAILFALPQTSMVKVAVAVQPMTPSVFSRRFTVNLFGFLGSLIGAASALFYNLFGGPRLSGIVPAFAAAGSGNVPVLYIQGTGDEWGSVEDVSVMADMTPGAKQLLFVNSQHRFDGYTYVLDHPAAAIRFLTENLD